MPDVEIRTIEPDELVAYIQVVGNALAFTRSVERIERGRGMAEYDRSFAAVDGDRIVGVTRFNSFDLSLPGGVTLACAACTGVGVMSTHRRRGLMTQLMRRGLDQAHERGDVVAALYASESAIYGRFGFGPAVPSDTRRVDRSRVRLLDPPEPGGIELVDTTTAAEIFPAVYDRCRQRRHGMLSRSPAMWDLRVAYDPVDDRDGMTERFCAWLPDRGFAIYRLRGRWDGLVPDYELVVDDLVAVDADAELGLWRYLLGVDLVSTITARCRPADDTLPFAVTDLAHVAPAPEPPLELRLVDVAGALTARPYAVRDHLVLRVVDPFAAWNDDTWELDVEPDGASCRRTDADADLTLDVRHLATVYLGGERPTRLLDAGRLVEHRPGAAARLGRMLATDRAPWNPTGI